MARDRNPEQPTTRSFRVSARAWNEARKRAVAEGVTMSAAIADLVEGYGRGVYNLPTRRIVRDYPENAEMH